MMSYHSRSLVLPLVLFMVVGTLGFAGCLETLAPTPPAGPVVDDPLAPPDDPVPQPDDPEEPQPDDPEEPQPDDPEEPPPPPPPPPPIGETGLAGGTPLSGNWAGWVGRHGMGEKFGSEGEYGWMGPNTNAAVKMPGAGNGGWTRGWFECEIYYDTTIPPGEGGGQHLIGLFSQSAARTGPYDPTLDYTLGEGDPLEGALRLDFDVKPDLVGLVIFQNGEPSTFRIGHVNVDAWRNWVPLRVEWSQRDGHVEFVINGQRFTAETARGLNPLGNLLLVGNMDTNRGERCVGENNPCGTIGKIRYRNFRWGQR